MSVVIAGAFAAGIAGCGDRPERPDRRLPAGELRVYTSLPLSGRLRTVGEEVLRGETLALREAGGRAGRRRIALVPLDVARDADHALRRHVSANARRAAGDRAAIAYLGEVERGASTVSARFTNVAGLLHVSPRDADQRLAESEGDLAPTGRRTFARVVASDTAEIDLLIEALTEARARRLVVTDDGSEQSTALAERLVAQLPDAVAAVVVRRSLREDADPGELSDAVALQRADAVVHTGRPAPAALEALREAAARETTLRLFATDAFTLASPDLEPLGPARRRLTVTGLVRADGAPADFESRYRAEYGRAPRFEAELGYRAMQLVLRAARAADREQPLERAEVVSEGVRLADDVGATRFAVLRLRGDRFVRFERDTAGDP